MMPSGTGRFVESWLPYYEEFGRFSRSIRTVWIECEDEGESLSESFANAMPGS
jgi:hypothetical protein